MLKFHADRFGKKPPVVGTIFQMPDPLPRPLAPMPSFTRAERHGRYEVVAYPVYDDRAATTAAPCAYRPYRPMAHCVTIRRLSDGTLRTIATHYLTRITEEW